MGRMTNGSHKSFSAPELMSAINAGQVPCEKLAKLKDPQQLVCIAVCMAVFAGLFLAIGNTVLTWSVFVLGAILFCSEVLTLSMPRSIWNRLVSNCVRGDGSWSPGRTSLERKSLSKFRLNLVFVMMMCVLPSLFALWVFNREVIPIGIGVDALGSMSADADQWKSNLRAQEQHFERWQKSSLFASGVDVHQHKRALWDVWPFLFAGGILWCILMFTVVAKYYIYCIHKLKESVYSRANDYRWRDLSRQPDICTNSDAGSRRRKHSQEASELA